MPRPRRLNLPGVPQHVTQRGNNRQPCFHHDLDRSVYLHALGKATERHDVDIHAYVLMPNHVHLLMTPRTPDGVSRVMQSVGRIYVRYFNDAHERTGTLWEGRFKSSLVDTEAYCLACYRYIELNPVRAALVSSPDGYRWSSYGHNAHARTDRLVSPHPMWLALAKGNAERCHAYRKLCGTEQPESELHAIRSSNLKGLPIGSEEFQTLIEAGLHEHMAPAAAV
jgi:putative transposase